MYRRQYNCDESALELAKQSACIALYYR